VHGAATAAPATAASAIAATAAAAPAAPPPPPPPPPAAAAAAAAAHCSAATNSMYHPHWCSALPCVRPTCCVRLLQHPLTLLHMSVLHSSMPTCLGTVRRGTYLLCRSLMHSASLRFRRMRQASGCSGTDVVLQTLQHVSMHCPGHPANAIFLLHPSTHSFDCHAYPAPAPAGLCCRQASQPTAACNALQVW
jgi:hypothetical protein